MTKTALASPDPDDEALGGLAESMGDGESLRDDNSVSYLIHLECAELAEFLAGKNRKYGNAAIEPQRIFSKAKADEQLNVRIDDKLSRVMSGQLDDTEDVELDLIGYLLLKRIYRRLESK